MAMDFDVLSRLRATWPQTTLQISGREIEVVRTAGAAAGPRCSGCRELRAPRSPGAISCWPSAGGAR